MEKHSFTEKYEGYLSDKNVVNQEFWTITVCEKKTSSKINNKTKKQSTSLLLA